MPCLDAGFPIAGLLSLAPKRSWSFQGRFSLLFFMVLFDVASSPISSGYHSAYCEGVSMDPETRRKESVKADSPLLLFCARAREYTQQLEGTIEPIMTDPAVDIPSLLSMVRCSVIAKTSLPSGPVKVLKGLYLWTPNINLSSPAAEVVYAGKAGCAAYPHVLDALHEADHAVGSAVADELLLGHAQAVLGADAAVALLDPLVDERLEHLLDPRIVPPHGGVEVQVRVAHVAVADDADDGELVRVADEARRLHPLVRVLDELVHVGNGDGHVVLVRAAPVAEALGDALAPAPEGLGLRLVLREHTVRDDLVRHDVLEELFQLLVVVVAVGPARLDEAVERVLVLEGPLGVAPHPVHELLAAGVHELKGRQNLRQLALGRLERLLHLVERLEAEEGDVDGARALRADDGHLGDDADGALAADEELLEVVARVVLAQRAEVLDDGAVGQDGLEAEDVAVQAAVAQQTQAAGVGGHVAADVARALGSEVEGEDVALLGEELVGRLENDAGVDDERAADVVKRLNLVHAAHVDDDLVEDGDRAANEAGVAALGHDGKLVVVAVLEDLADLLRRGRLEQELALAAVLAHPVLVESLEVFRRISRHAVNDTRGTQQVFEECDMLLRDLAEPRVALHIRIRVGRQLDLLETRSLLRSGP
ncbi:hypothetical protein BN1708_010508 [Verticillium longisporum]|uniref:Uncharacterized protein n=1 Tax=Verticillium longisporum TaxID=100787 RepID=A0A0G4KRK6_VERLO|nr:hypothetical protein BN1708_010508 [Verticillium longisporum]